MHAKWLRALKTLCDIYPRHLCAATQCASSKKASGPFRINLARLSRSPTAYRCRVLAASAPHAQSHTAAHPDRTASGPHAGRSSAGDSADGAASPHRWAAEHPLPAPAPTHPITTPVPARRSPRNSFAGQPQDTPTPVAISTAPRVPSSRAKAPLQRRCGAPHCACVPSASHYTPPGAISAHFGTSFTHQCGECPPAAAALCSAAAPRAGFGCRPRMRPRWSISPPRPRTPAAAA